LIFRTTYNSAEISGSNIIIDGITYGCIVGKHCIWIPELEIKIPWVFNGKIESILHWERGRNAEQLKNQTFNDNTSGWDELTLISIQNEYNIFELLAEKDMSPKPYGYVYIKTITSDFLRGAKHTDPMGCIGFYIKNANKLPPGKYNSDRFIREYIQGGWITCSDGAIGDLRKDGNVINGYLIDIRRTIWDMMRLVSSVSGYTKDITDTINDTDEGIKVKVLKYGQFPFKERKKAYQTYWFKDHYEDGTRQTIYRFDKMGIESALAGKTVVDLGCQIGSICSECYQRGARWITGLDYQEEYVDCAQDLVRLNHHQINYRVMDLANVESVKQYLFSYYKEPIDIVFLLSMYKHIESKCWELLKNIKFKRAYIESNNCPQGYEGDQAKIMEAGMRAAGFNPDRIGMTEDRSPRCLWRIISCV
jgi:hypothetical protein